MSGIGIADWCLNPEAGPSKSELVRLGVVALHADFGNPDGGAFLGSADVCRDYFRTATEAGIQVTAFALNVIESIGVDSQASARKSLDLLKLAIDTAAKKEVPLIYVPSFGRADIRDPLTLRSTIGLLQAACAHSEGSNVQVATENALDPVTVKYLMKEVSHPRLRLLADLYNPVLKGRYVPDVLRALLPYLARQIHVKDGRGGIVGNESIGEGDGAFEESASVLVRENFHCLAVLENDYRNRCLERIQRDVATIKRHMSEILCPGISVGGLMPKREF